MSQINDDTNSKGIRTNPIIKSSMLRPSALQLGSSSSSTGNGNDQLPSSTSKSNVLKPTLFKSPKLAEVAASTGEDEISTTTHLNSTGSENTPSGSAANGVEEPKPSSDPIFAISNNGFQKSNLFVTAKTTIPISENVGFVFGENVHERVTGADSILTADSASSAKLASSSSSGVSGSAGGGSGSGGGSKSDGNELFAIAGSSKSSDNQKPLVEASVESLNEVARVYEESRAQKRKYEEVETFTGEEDEINVLDVNSKLFAFVASNWEERGPGSLRVNDSKEKKCSRVVFRTSGNLRVLLNTKVWPGMVVERPSQKSLRLTAIDSAGQIKIFLAMARPDDISNLYTQLSNRIEKAKLSADNDTADCKPPKLEKSDN